MKWNYDPNNDSLEAYRERLIGGPTAGAVFVDAACVIDENDCQTTEDGDHPISEQFENSVKYVETACELKLNHRFHPTNYSLFPSLAAGYQSLTELNTYCFPAAGQFEWIVWPAFAITFEQCGTAWLKLCRILLSLIGL